jgi:hypothetical protein
VTAIEGINKKQPLLRRALRARSNFVISRAMDFLINNSSSKAHLSIVILMLVVSLSIITILFALLFNLSGWLNLVEQAGYYIGCVGFGEIARVIAKSKLSDGKRYKSILTTAIAGASTALVISILLVLKWGYHIYSVGISLIVGTCFYLFMAWLFKLQDKHQKALNNKSVVDAKDAQHN